MATTTSHNTQLRGRDVYAKYVSLIRASSAFLQITPKRFRASLLQFRQNSNARFSRVVRFMALRTLAESCGDLVDIRSQCTLLNLSSLSIGSRVSIHPVCYIEAGGGITIGNDVSIAHHTTVLSTSHTWARSDIPIRDQPIEKRPTCIKDNVWIGAGARIMGGITIGEGAIVASGAVVTKDVPPNSIVAGVPARVIRHVN